MLDINCYCELVTNVVYDNFQDILVSIQCSREYKKFLKSISIHFNNPFVLLKHQTSGHNNIPLLGVIYNYLV